MEVVTRIVIDAGKIASRDKVEVKKADKSMLAVARKLLTELRKGGQSVSHTAPDGAAITIRLGIPKSEETRDAIRAYLQSLEPTRDVKAIYAVTDRVENATKHSHFVVTCGEVTARYRLVRRDCRDDDPGLFGLVAGSYGASTYATRPEMPRDLHDESAAAHEQLLRTVRQIVALRPAFIVPGDENSLWNIGDHLAIAMLIDAL